MAKDSKEIESTKRLMGALVRMKPRPHEEMKVGKKVNKAKKTVKKRNAPNTPR
jgi:hypothetical protein